MSSPLDARRLRSYGFWSFWVGLVFFAVYPATNWITSLRAAPLHLYAAFELTIPFVPQFIWPYLSMYVLFLLPAFFVPAKNMAALGKQLIAGSLLAAVLFLLLPAQLGFVRELPKEAPYAAIYGGVFAIDGPHNLVPSLHVIFSSAVALACADFARPPVRIAILAWLCVIVASTVLVHQHHVLDVMAAAPIVAFLRRRYDEPASGALLPTAAA